jgi:ribonuclease E
MSRQRIRSSVLESSTEKCPHCGGSGHVRSVSSLALQVLRALEEQLMKGATHNLIARTRPDVALYVLNQKRAHLRGLEERFAITITISADESVMAPQAFIIDRGEQVHTPEAAKALAERTQTNTAPLEDEDDLEDLVAAEEDESADEAASPATVPEQGEGGPRRRRRRRRGGRNGGRNGDDSEQGHGQPPDQSEDQGREHVAITGPADDFAADGAHEAAPDEGSGEHSEFTPQDRGENGEQPRESGERRRRRGRRGGRRNRQRNGDGTYDRNQQDSRQDSQEGAEQSFAPAEELIAQPSAEPELNSAVADLDASPPAPRDAPVRAEVQPATPASHPPAEAEPPRRRSTVRERAPVTSGEDVAAAPTPPSSAPEPTVTEGNGAADGDRPRRTGWWSRRFAGG